MASKISFPHEAIVLVATMHGRGASYKQILAALVSAFPGRRWTYHSVKNLIHQYIQGALEPPKVNLPLPTLDEIVEAAQKQRKIQTAFDLAQSEVYKSLPDALRWILLVFQSDYHVPSVRSNLTSIIKTRRLIASTPGVYELFAGDANDGFLGNPLTPWDGVWEATLIPRIARHVVKELFALTGPRKTLAVCSGCHEAWLQKIDMNLIEILAGELKIPYLAGGGIVHLAFPSGTYYQIDVSHRPRWHSNLNPFHSCQRHIERINQAADIVAIGHNHVEAIGISSVGGRERILIRTGTAKEPDYFARRIGYRADNKLTLANSPSVLLDTKERAWEIATSIERGIERLEYLNNLAD